MGYVPDDPNIEDLIGNVLRRETHDNKSASGTGSPQNRTPWSRCIERKIDEFKLRVEKVFRP